MPLPENISADYTFRPSEFSEVLALPVEARQPTVVWGPPGAAKSQVAQQAAAATRTGTPTRLIARRMLYARAVRLNSVAGSERRRGPSIA